MKAVKTVLSFLIYSNLFIATCAAALTWESYVLLQLHPGHGWLILLTAASTLFIYSLHYQVKSSRLEKTGDRMEWCRANARVLPFTLILSGSVIATELILHYKVIFLSGSALHYLFLLLIPLAALAYSHPLFKKELRTIGWLKPLLLAFTWTAATALLPWLLEAQSRPLDTAVLLWWLHRFCFIATLVVLFNTYDIEEDRRDGVFTPVVRLGQKRALHWGKWLFPFLHVGTALLLASNFLGWNIPVLSALLLPAGMIYFLFARFNPAENEISFILKYDGLMLIKSLLLIFAILYL